MANLVLAVAALCQTPQWVTPDHYAVDYRHRALLDTVTDLAFAAAVEEQVVDFAGPAAAERPYRAWYTLLAWPCYRTRASAGWVLGACGPAALPVFAAGKRHHDPEVAAACLRLEDRLFACRCCGGRGRHDHDAAGPQTLGCPECDDSGDVRFLVRTDPGSGLQVVQQIDLFFKPPTPPPVPDP